MKEMIRKEDIHLFHTTSYRNMKSILKTGKIAIAPKRHNEMMLETSPGFIFANLVFNDIANYVKQDILHWIGECVIELDIDLLRQYTFIVGRIGGFDEVKDKSAKELKEMKNVYAYGSGNLKKFPSLKRVKEQIMTYMEGPAYISQYMHSHEVLFMKDIPLSLCKRIIVYNERLYKNIKSYLRRYKINNIDVTLFPQQAMINTQVFIDRLVV